MKIRNQVSALFRITLSLVLCGLLLACSTVQTTSGGTIGIDRKQRMSPLVPAEKLNEGARTAYAQVLSSEQKKGTLNADASMTNRVRKISQRIIPQVGVFRKDALRWDWKVNVIQSDQLNAWCMPGGKIAFYSGIITKLKLTDDEIAAIMGHEIAHALREHSRERASEQSISELLISIGAVAVGADPNSIDMSRLAYHTVFGLKNSREHETEADRIGVELAARAGFNPTAAVTLWQKMGRETGGKSGPEFLSTHPSPKTRIADLKKYAVKVRPLYEKSR